MNLNQSKSEKKPVTKQEFLEYELEKLIKNYRNDRERHKKQAMTLKILTVALSASITILLGVTGFEAYQNWFKNAALILGALITVVSAYEAFFYPRTLWVQETKVFARLKDLQRQLLYNKTGQKDGEIEEVKLDQIKKGLDSALQESLDDWLMLRGVTEAVKKPNEEEEAQNKKQP